MRVNPGRQAPSLVSASPHPYPLSQNGRRESPPFLKGGQGGFFPSHTVPGFLQGIAPFLRFPPNHNQIWGKELNASPKILLLDFEGGWEGAKEGWGISLLRFNHKQLIDLTHVRQDRVGHLLGGE